VLKLYQKIRESSAIILLGFLSTYASATCSRIFCPLSLSNSGLQSI